MKISEFALAFGLMFLLLVAAPGASAQEDTGQTWLWTTPEPPIPGRHLSLDVSRIEDGEAGQVIHFDCAIRSTVAYNNTRVVFALFDTDGVVVGEGEERLNVLAGANQCRIAFDTSALPLGTYRARFYLTNPQLPGEPSHTFTLRKVNDRNLLEQLAASRARLEMIEAALGESESVDGSLPYLRLKASVAADVLKKAEENSQAAEWESLERRLSFISNRLDTIRAGMIFGNAASERLPEIVSPRLDGLAIEHGGFAAQGRPVFLFGAALPALDGEALAHLRRYQFNAATVTVGREEIPGESQSPSAQAARLRDVFDSAVVHNVSVMVQLAPDQVTPALLTAHPDVKHEGQVDIGRPEVRAEWEGFLAQVTPALKGQPMLAGVSIANDPHFRFDGPAVRDGFLEYIRANYPDRLTLNRSWRSHLATYEEIVPWSTDPLDSYQAHRPYQFDWQTYHQSLGNAYFDWARRQVESQIPGASLSATMSDAVFVQGETRHGLNRERLSSLLDIAGCSAEVAADDPIYAMGYPNSSAYYTLLKSFQPGQPVFNLHNRFTLGAHSDSEENFRFVHAAVWEGVISGLNGATVPMDSLLFQQPEALEGFATAALDINRLAPIVRAMQNAPTDVGILFSYASKVFDDGDPHLESAINAYEGAAFGGYNVRFITEEQCVNGALEGLKILVLPNTPALGDGAFQKIAEFVDAGGTVARTGTPLPYNERGVSRGDLIRNTGNTVLVRGLNLPTEYLHAMDAATVLGALPQIPRAITPQGYPVEGVKTRYVEFEGGYYIYMLNIRKDPVSVALATQVNRGRDLIQGQDVEFPATLEPLVPRLIKLEPVDLEMKVTVATEAPN